jgi:hypothetical protein
MLSVFNGIPRMYHTLQRILSASLWVALLIALGCSKRITESQSSEPTTSDPKKHWTIAKAGLENARPGQKIKFFGQLNVVEEGNGKVIYVYASGSADLK